MEINGCVIPDDLCYDGDMLIWLRERENGFDVGLTSIAVWLAGPSLSLRLKKEGETVESGKNLVVLEGSSYFGVARLEFPVRIVSHAQQSLHSFRDLSNIYSSAVMFVEPLVPREQVNCLMGESAVRKANQLISSYRLNCFSVIPDTTMVEIGSECSAVLTRLRETIAGRPEGFTIHLVSDDPTAPMEIVRFTDELKLKLVEQKKKENVYHFLIMK